MKHYTVEFSDTVVGPVPANNEDHAKQIAIEIACRRRKVISVTEVQTKTKVKYG